MASSSTTPELQQTEAVAASLAIRLPSLTGESFDQMRAHIAEAFAGESVVVATPDEIAQGNSSMEAFRVETYTPAARSAGQWTLTAADYLGAHELAQRHQARAVLLLGAEAQSLGGADLRALAMAALDGRCDLAVPRYTLPPRTGMVNSAILYPVSRALFGAVPRFPLALDLALSMRMTERMATAGRRFIAANQMDALLWPVSEAAVAGYPIEQVDTGTRAIPQPSDSSLNTVLAQVVGSLFADVEAKASFWQRVRMARPANAMPTPESAPMREDVSSMLETFRLAHTSLQEIWSLVLPPRSLLGLQKLSAMPSESFAMPDSLWARIVYDFLVAYRLRTINRGHLLGALTPLYLGWAASHILSAAAGTPEERHTEAVAAAFETEKPYLVSRWRWPDRFNP